MMPELDFYESSSSAYCVLCPKSASRQWHECVNIKAIRAYTILCPQDERDHLVTVSSRYSTRAAEYCEALGSIARMEPTDVALIESWGASVAGDVLDAGCGPGHWSRLLASSARTVTGVDLTPEFIEHARTASTAQNLTFEVMDMVRTPYTEESFAGILAWYSLIHTPPAHLPGALTEFYRLLNPGGSLLLGMFLGEHGQPFDHAVTTAYYVSVSGFSAFLEDTEFTIAEVHTRSTGRHRDHLAIVARKAG